MTTIRQRFNGWHMTAILVSFFTVVIAVNFMMAKFAVSTFGGVVVENSYVASQGFNRWLDEAAKEKALGWKASAARRSDDRVQIDLVGVPAQGIALTGIARHPLGRLPDHEIAFERAENSSFVSTAALPKGRWRLRLIASASGKTWRREIEVP